MYADDLYVWGVGAALEQIAETVATGAAIVTDWIDERLITLSDKRPVKSSQHYRTTLSQRPNFRRSALEG